MIERDFSSQFRRKVNYGSEQVPTEGYKIRERTFEDIRKLFSKDYKRFNFPYIDSDGVYVGFEDGDKESSDEQLRGKKCNLTFLGNLDGPLGDERRVVMGSTMGHFHPLKLSLQEVYEFEGFGAMVIDDVFVFMEPFGKVYVPGDVNMTLYNLQREPLETRDFANPRFNESHKKLQEKIGPILCISYSPETERMNFVVNPEHTSGKFSRMFSLPCRLSSLGEDLLEQREELRERFSRVGITFVLWNELAECKAIPYSKRLDDLVREKSKSFCEAFKI